MRAADIIVKKRGSTGKPPEELSREELSFLINGYVDGSIPDYQMSAFLMAVYFNGMTFTETGILTDLMLHSGEVIDLYKAKEQNPSLIGPFVDKHSTGGVGDKISLPLAPIAASLGVQIPMMSGRGLGHTGGTLDKLEAIDGYTVGLSKEHFAELIAKTGYAMTGQTEQIVPADRKMYALRDVTGTVESIPLITASILSKKIAEGSDALVFDVKFGSGAFMKTKEEAEALAVSLVKTAKTMHKEAVAFLTRMNTPLGNKIGNYLEIEETVECLEGKGPADVMELTYALSSEMVLLSKKAKNREEALNLCKESVKSGKALKLFLQNVKDQGGNPEALMAQIGKRRSKFHTELFAERDGYIGLDAYKTGIACVNLGVGRNKTTDTVSPDAGIILAKREGDAVRKGDKLMDVYAKDELSLSRGKEALAQAIFYEDEPITEENLIFKEIR